MAIKGKRGYAIAIHMWLTLPHPELIAHEAAHVAEDIKYGEMGHSEKWKEMFEISKAVLNV